MYSTILPELLLVCKEGLIIGRVERHKENEYIRLQIHNKTLRERNAIAELSEQDDKVD